MLIDAIRKRSAGTISLAVAGWIIAEILTFMLVISRFGLFGAALIGLATTGLGIWMLRKASKVFLRDLKRLTKNKN